jgi:leucyl-tRNA synthetase
MDNKQLESHILALPILEKFIEGKQIKKVIVVPGKIVNLVVG